MTTSDWPDYEIPDDASCLDLGDDWYDRLPCKARNLIDELREAASDEPDEVYIVADGTPIFEWYCRSDRAVRVVLNVCRSSRVVCVATRGIGVVSYVDPKAFTIVDGRIWFGESVEK